jgi:hypothetical protein
MGGSTSLVELLLREGSSFTSQSRISILEETNKTNKKKKIQHESSAPKIDWRK